MFKDQKWESEATRLLEKKSEVLEVEKMLDEKRDEFASRMDRVGVREEKLKEDQANLRHKILSSEKHIKVCCL